MGKIPVIIIVILGLVSCTKGNKISGLTIDPAIKGKAEKHISESKDYKKMGDELMLIYENALLGEFYKNDTLFFSNGDARKKQLFKSFYYWKGDTLTINGGYGIFGSMGFYLAIKNNKAEVFHMLSSDDFATYAYTENDSLINRLEVPCTETTIVLSEVPDKTKQQLIYGYVAFKSATFYGAGNTTQKGEIPPKSKLRSNMRIYFKVRIVQSSKVPVRDLSNNIK